MIIDLNINFEDAIREVEKDLSNQGEHVKSGAWQGIEKEVSLFEADRVSFACLMLDDLKKMAEEIKPNLPWADLHFFERISGNPTNPGEAYKIWPDYKPGTFKENEKFSHTYQERFWPKQADMEGMYPNNPEWVKEYNVKRRGIRYVLGDLEDLINLLIRDPGTRQAFLPIWFPEDTGAVHGGRVPCSLGYLFNIRKDQLHITYYIRSCDFFRHFRDDVYLCVRLALYVMHKLKTRDIRKFNDLGIGIMTMHIGSLHIFSQEYKKLFYVR